MIASIDFVMQYLLDCLVIGL